MWLKYTAGPAVVQGRDFRIIKPHLLFPDEAILETCKYTTEILERLILLRKNMRIIRGSPLHISYMNLFLPIKITIFYDRVRNWLEEAGHPDYYLGEQIYFIPLREDINELHEVEETILNSLRSSDPGVLSGRTVEGKIFGHQSMIAQLPHSLFRQIGQTGGEMCFGSAHQVD